MVELEILSEQLLNSGFLLLNCSVVALFKVLESYFVQEFINSFTFFRNLLIGCNVRLDFSNYSRFS